MIERTPRRSGRGKLLLLFALFASVAVAAIALALYEPVEADWAKTAAVVGLLLVFLSIPLVLIWFSAKTKREIDQKRNEQRLDPMPWQRRTDWARGDFRSSYDT